MEIKTASDLDAAIDKLKKQEKVHKDILAQNFHTTANGLKPLNILKKTAYKLLHSSEVKTNVLNATVGLGAGILSKKILVGKPTNLFKKLLGMAVEFTVAGAITKNSQTIKTKGATLLSSLFKSNRNNGSGNN